MENRAQYSLYLLYFSKADSPQVRFRLHVLSTTTMAQILIFIHCHYGNYLALPSVSCHYSNHLALPLVSCHYGNCLALPLVSCHYGNYMYITFISCHSGNITNHQLLLQQQYSIILGDTGNYSALLYSQLLITLTTCPCF